MPLPDDREIEGVLAALADETRRFHAELAARPVRGPGAGEAAAALAGPLPAEGSGAAAALQELLEKGRAGVVASAGPRFFHFVIGGVTPAALGGDWLAALFDQVAASWVCSPLAVELEDVALRWLLELFELPLDWSGTLVTGAQMANFTGLAAARQWWGERHGADVSRRGLAGLPKVPVFSSGYLHASSFKALAMLGIGRDAARCFSADGSGRLDREALEAALAELDGAPAILVANAGEVNSGAFDPVEEMAELAERYGAWLHVDGAFGLFARVSPRTAPLAAGVERAHSVTVDGHKWLNVPYDSGFAFVHDRRLLARAFRLVADYLPKDETPRPVLSNLCPESSRRARSFAVWATLRAYGREGVRAMVEGHLDLAAHLARLVDEAPELERLADVPLNIVCFRLHPPGARKRDLDELNERLGRAVLEDGRVFVGTTRYAGRTALRPAIVNWRTGRADVELLVRVVRELAAGLGMR